jgi:hypothetical protein
VEAIIDFQHVSEEEGDFIRERLVKHPPSVGGYKQVAQVLGNKVL